ncbi:GntR family transcriptional regulator [bacterium C-53]|nr:GntR family transcriptional regulator [Lachnospiraceae bacterium]NBI04549.1 GntR family transcriptional regulator [Lachnospiraceae bacterium]RKJ08039.1 GntR family transcriptional regulator [bacterium C-53]
MAWNLDDNRPIYLQLVEEMQLRIVTGIYLPGEKIPSVRELAAEAAVNPNTMQKAFGELERSGLIITQRTSGRMVTKDASLINEIKNLMAKDIIDAFLNNMKQLGYTRENTLNLLADTLKKEDSL